MNEETRWFNQVLMTYKDQVYGSNSYLRLSAINSTVDLKSFNQTNIQLFISNNIQKICVFRHYDVIKLLKACEQFIDSLKAPNSTFDSTITQKLKDYQLHFIFFVGDNEALVKIQIINNETDMVSCIMPFRNYFESFLRIFRQYSENYLSYSNSFIQTILMTNMIEHIEQIPVLIRGALSQITSNISTQKSYPVENDSVLMQEANKTEMTIKDLNQFLGHNMENIVVEEIDSGKIEQKAVENKLVEIDSFLLNKILKWDLRNLENILLGISLKPYPVLELNKKFGEASNNEALPGISDNELKSILYISKFLHQYFDVCSTEYNGEIPSSFGILKYQANTYNLQNIELALDLFTIGGFIRQYRRRMESKVSSKSRDINGINFHMAFRLFTDPFVFSFLETSDKATFKSVILNRYNYFDQKGLFDYYKKTLTEHNCIGITHFDIENYVTEIIDYIFGKIPTIEQFHNSEYEKGHFTIPFVNSLNKEQIIEEVIPLEIKLAFDDNAVNSNLLIPEEILSYFKKAEKNKPTTVEKNNLLRFMKPYEKQIPERFRVEFLKKLEFYSNKNFIIDDSYPYEEFGDDVVKILYLWKPEEDEKLSKNYKYLGEKYNDMIQTKDIILTIGSNIKETSDYDSTTY
jgi:hypothetical protein